MEDEILLLKTAVIEENRENGRETAMALTLPVENRNGFIFSVAEAKSRSIFAQTIMEIICDRLARLANTLQDNASAPHRFEQTLEAINEEIAARAAEMETFNPGDLNAVIGLAVDKTMYLSGTGELPAIFLHKLPEGKYQIFNLARSIHTEQAAASWQKIFVVVLDGDLNPGDVFCVCNKNLQSEMPPEELHSLLAALPPPGAAEKLRQYFPLEIDLSLFILRVSGGDEDRPKISAPASLKQLQASREQTKQVLADQKPNLFRTLALWFTPFLKNKQIWWRLAKTLIRLLLSSVMIIWAMLRDFGHGSFRLTKRLASAERKEVFAEVGSSCGHGFNLCRRKIHRLPKTSRYLILAALILVVIIIFSVMVVSRDMQAREDRAAFEVAITRVEALHDAAESALIYQDETKAKSLLSQAETALKAIVTENEDNLKQIQTVSQEVKKTINSLRRLTEIDNPEIIASNPAGQPSLRTIILANGEIYAGGDGNNIFHLNKSAKSFDQFIGGDFKNASAFSYDNGVVASIDSGTDPVVTSVINLFDTATKTIKAAATAPSGEKWLDLYAYSDRVYVLSPGQGLSSQIYKMFRTGLALSAPTPWIKSPVTELSDAVSFAVDGTVFILRSNGKILRFVSGRDVAWTQGEVDPTLTSASSIWTSANSSYVYVLDPTGQRLVVYEKESGLLSAQYHSSAFTNLEDFAVDETNKIIYLLGNGNIYKIGAGHLK